MQVSGPPCPCVHEVPFGAFAPSRVSFWRLRNDCSGEFSSLFCGQTEWSRVDRQSSRNRGVFFSQQQSATINQITVVTDISENPPPFRLATLRERKSLALTRQTHQRKSFANTGQTESRSRKGRPLRASRSFVTSCPCLHRHGAVHQPDAGVDGVAVDAGVGQGGARQRLRTEQTSEGGVVDEDGFGIADDVCDLGNAR